MNDQSYYNIKIVVFDKDGIINNEKSFHDSVGKIEIGRNVAAEHILIPVEHISHIHAIIKRESNRFYIMDNKSTNGTRLNDSTEQLDPKKWYPIQNGDMINIVDYKLKFSIIETPRPDPVQEIRDQKLVISNLLNSAKEIVLNLKRVLPENSDDILIQWKEDVRDILRTYFDKMQKCDAIEVAILIKDQIPDRWQEIDDIIREDEFLNEIVYKWLETVQIHTAAHEELVKLKHKLYGDFAAFGLKSDISNFVQRIEDVYSEFAENYIKLFKSRSSFQQEMDAPLTKLWGWSSNLVKSVRSPQKLASYLFDWHLEEQAKDPILELRSALNDVMLHQEGILKAYLKAVPLMCRKLINDISPDNIDDEIVKSLRLRFGKFSISFAFWPIAQIKSFFESKRRIRLYKDKDNSEFLNEFESYLIEEYKQAHKK